MAFGPYLKTSGQNSDEFRKHVSIYQSGSVFNQEIFRACRFERQEGSNIRLLDAMAGPGKLGKLMHSLFMNGNGNRQNEHQKLSVYFNDVIMEPIRRLRREDLQTLPCDVKHVYLESSKFNIAVVRFGIKDLPHSEQGDAIWALVNSLVPGGRLVIADMYAPSEKTQEALIEIHATKQRFAGRIERMEKTCYIPTEEEWLTYVRWILSPSSVVFKTTSGVDTQDWRGQFGTEEDEQEIIRQMNALIIQTCERCPGFAEEFQVKLDDGRVTMQFPVLIIAGNKY